jgi:integrase/recombinase XerD
LLYSSGLRIGELINLKLEDINLNQRTLIECGDKGSKDRMMIIGEVMKQKILEYTDTFKPSVWLFNGPGGGTYSSSSVNKIIGRAAKKADITLQLSAHTLRHSRHSSYATGKINAYDTESARPQ